MARSFDTKRGGWPYSATADNRPLYTPDTGLNQLISTPLAYVGGLTKDDKLLRIACQALTASRQPHGGMDKRAEFATSKVLSESGQTVAQDKCSTDDKHDFTFPLVGKGLAQFKVMIDDDQRGVWDLSGDNLQIVTKTSPDFRIGGVGRTRYYFMVPAGTTQFSLKLVGVHSGPYGAVVLSPAERVAAVFQGSNSGAALIQDSAAANAPRPNHP